jgi:heat shock protein HslJ
MTHSMSPRKAALFVFGVPVVALAITVVPLAMLTRCTAAPKAVDPAAEARAAKAAAAPGLVGTSWNCLTIGTTKVNGPHPPSLAFGTDGRASGFGGVNRYGGPWEMKDGALHFGDMSCTRMAGTPERMELETRYLAALARASVARLDGHVLTLGDATGPLLTFGPAPKPDEVPPAR